MKRYRILMWFKSLFDGWYEVLDAEKAHAQMYPVTTLPVARLLGDYRSTLLVVGQYLDGKLTLYPNLAYYHVWDDVWMDDKTNKPLTFQVTHWINASEQDKLNVISN